MTPTVTLHNGDALAVLPTLPDASVDSLVTDPPAGIEFMGKEWDSPGKWSDAHSSFGFRGSGIGGVTSQVNTRNPNCKRCRKHVRGSKGCRCPEGPDMDEDLSFQQRQLVRTRDRFVVFLSSVMRECHRVLKPGAYGLVWAIPRTSHWTALALEDAGFEIRDRISHLFGTGFPKAKSCLKPACEDWWLIRKPGRGVKALPGLDECRIGTTRGVPASHSRTAPKIGVIGIGANRCVDELNPNLGRWPANVVLDEAAAELIDEQTGDLGTSAGGRAGHTGAYSGGFKREHYGDLKPGFGDSGGASRFFYCAKASKSDRGDGNTHPTVKSTDLMRWLCRLITPPDGTVLDCFMGSGSTGKAALSEGFNFIGIEREQQYHAVAEQRIAAAQHERSELLIA